MNLNLRYKTILVFFFILFLIRIDIGYSLPEIEEVVSGEVTIQSPDTTTMNITASDKAIINYTSFNIMENESVYVILPSSQAEILNRVTGPNVSQLFGYLSCNGLFILTNPSGISIGPNATIDAHSLILSTRDITNSDFINGDYVFRKLSDEELDMLLVNKGNINITEAGFGVLIAGAIENDGKIVARLGKVVLASGDAVKLDISDNGLISVVIDQEVASQIVDHQGNPITTQINNTGSIEADGGTVILNAQSLPDIFEKAINLDGFVKANRLEENNGIIQIVASNDVSLFSGIEATEATIYSDTKVELVGPEPAYFYGDITFYNFECTVPDKEIYFESGKTYTFRENLTIVGSPNIGPEEYYIKLHSSNTGKPWYLDIQSDNYTLDRVNIKDSYAKSLVIVPRGADGGNNTNFRIDPFWIGGGGADPNWSTPANWEGGTPPGAASDVTFGGDGAYDNDSTIDSTWVTTYGGSITSITINTTYGGTITIGAGATLTVTGAFTIHGGTFNSHGKTLTVGSYAQDGGVFTAEASTIKVSGDWAKSGGTFTAGASTVEFNGAGDQLISEVNTWNNVYINKTGGTIDFQYSSTITTLTTVGNNYNIEINSGQITNAAAVTIFLNTGSLYLNDDEAYVLTFAGGLVANSPSAIHTRGTIRTTDTTMDLGAITLDANTILSSGLGDMPLNSTINGAKTLTINNSDTTIFWGIVGGTTPLTSLTTDAGGTTAINTTAITTTSGQEYNDAVTLGENTTLIGSDIRFEDTIDGGYDLTVKAQDGLDDITFLGAIGSTTRLGDFTIENARDVTIGALTAVSFTQNDATGTTTFSGAVDLTGSVNIGYTGLTINAGSYDWEVGGDWGNIGGTFSHTGTVTFNGSGTRSLDSGGSDFYNIEHSGLGTLQLATNDLAVTGAFTNSAGTFNANGKQVTVTGLTTVSGGTYQASTATQTFNSGLTISGGTFSGSTGNVDVNGTLTLSDGTLTAPSGDFTVSGDWNRSYGTFSNILYTVTFDTTTTATIYGDSIFWNLKCITPGKEIRFEKDKTQRIDGTLTLTGTSENPIRLRSTQDGTQWKIDPRGTTRNISFVDVRDSNNINTLIISPTSSLDNGNNTNWFPQETQQETELPEDINNDLPKPPEPPTPPKPPAPEDEDIAMPGGPTVIPQILIIKGVLIGDGEEISMGDTTVIVFEGEVVVRSLDDTEGVTLRDGDTLVMTAKDSKGKEFRLKVAVVEGELKVNSFVETEEEEDLKKKALKTARRQDEVDKDEDATEL